MTGPDTRVCFVGDSFTVGIGDPTGAGWVGPLTTAARRAGHQLTAYQLGVRRDTSVDIARRWRTEVGVRLRDGDRSGLVLSFGTNDVDLHLGRPRVGLGRSLTVLGEVLDDAHTASWPVLVVGPPPGPDPSASGRAARLAAGMAQVCADRDVAFVDVTAALSADPEWLAEAAAGDRHHPSTCGYARLAALVAPAFDRWLAELAGTPGPAPCLLPDGLSARHPSAADHARMAVAMEHWWGGFGGAAGARQRAALLPRLFVDHFADTSFVVEDAGGELVAFLVGFLSASQPRTAYVHVVAVDPARQRAGLGQQLYRCFGAVAGERGATTVRCVTSPGNAASLAFHTALGFAVEPGEAGAGDGVETEADGVPVQRDHDGPGLDRISFVRRLPV